MRTNKRVRSGLDNSVASPTTSRVLSGPGATPAKTRLPRMNPTPHVVHSAEGQQSDELGARRERLRFVRYSFSRTRTAHCTAEVEVEWNSNDRYVGRAEGIATPLGDLRLTALATLDALERFSDGAMHFELIGVKTLRAFDATVAIVSVSYGQGAERQRLLGCYLSDDDTLKSAVLATLQATNRILGNYIASP